jgi:RND family efflux transporter MFP subunit
LKKQPVDIGTRVKEGDVLAEIEAPELVKALEQAKSKVIQANAQVLQSKSRVKTAEAEHEAAEALIAQNEADLEHANATYDYRVKAYNRTYDLFKKNAIDERLVDEKLDQREAALANKHSAAASILTAKAQASAAAAKIDQAKADLAEAEASVKVAESEVEKAQVFVDYLKITSPYDGVITRRTFFRGDFIRSADQGGAEPMLSVDRTDKMRVVIKIPDRDVPYTNVGDPAIVRIDALGEEDLKGTVARMANSEDPDTRTMRTEVDLPNDDGRLRDGMYGSVTVILDKNAKALTVPSGALIGESTRGKATLYVVEDGKAHRRAVRVGIDNGLETEVLSGLNADAQVVTRPPGGLSDGAPVDVVQAEKKTQVASEH